MKERIDNIKKFIYDNSKIIVPVVCIAVIAIVVAFMLNKSRGKAVDNRELNETLASVSSSEADNATTAPDLDKALQANTDQELYTLACTYYNATVSQDADTLRSICKDISDQDVLSRLEYGKYVKSYPSVEIYVKPGLNPGETLAFVCYKLVLSKYEGIEIPGYQAFYACTDENGKRYFNYGECTQEVNDYIVSVSEQDDVIEFNNRINVEFNDLMSANPEVLDYLNEVRNNVNTTVGVMLAKENEEETTPAPEGENTPPDTTEEILAQNVYAKATTTVNVRSSDSENAEKVGKATEGMRLLVLEQKVNGWSKVEFEGNQGFIKSEYLALEESAQDMQVIKTMTATDNVNVRAKAGEDADRIGTVLAGNTVDIIGEEGEWSKVNYEGSVGYIKTEFLQ